eukprot:353624-Chlamydomonas_euryale.AAC.4
MCRRWHKCAGVAHPAGGGGATVGHRSHAVCWRSPAPLKRNPAVDCRLVSEVLLSLSLKRGCTRDTIPCVVTLVVLQGAASWFFSFVCNAATVVCCAFAMGLVRLRASSFLSGFGLASILALYQIRRDVLNSHAEVKDEVRVMLDMYVSLSGCLDAPPGCCQVSQQP